MLVGANDNGLQAKRSSACTKIIKCSGRMLTLHRMQGFAGDPH